MLRFISFLCWTALGLTQVSGQQVDFGDDRTLSLTEMELIAIDVEGRQAVVVDDMTFDVSSLRNFGGLPKWPGGILPYAFAPNVSTLQKQIFANACAFWANVAAVSCRLRNNETNYVLVRNSSLNQSWVGMIGGQQALTVR